MQFTDLIEKHFRLQDSQKKALKKIGLKTIEDLLYHFPTRYGDTSEMKNIGGLVAGETAVIFGKITGLKTGKAWIKRTPISEGYIEDETGRIKAIWFHQPYIAKMIHEGALVRVEGKISDRKGVLGMMNPKIETVTKLPTGVGDSLFGEEGEAHSLYPVYSESQGITSNWFYHAIQKVFKEGILDSLTDPIPDYILKTYNLPTLATALVWIHAPLKKEHAVSARKRFAFEEVFFIQLQKKKDKMLWQKEPSFVIEKTPADVQSTTNLNYYGTTYSYTYDDLSLTSYDTTPPSTLKENFVARMKKFGIENLQSEINSKMLINKNAELVGGSDGSLSLKSGVNETVAKLDRRSWTKVQKSFLEAKNAKIPDEIYLQLEGVKGANDTNFLSVYVNQRLIKSVSLFGLLGASMKENPHGANGLSFKFNITEVIDDLHLDNDINLGALNIQITTKFPIPNNDEITVDRVAIYRLNK
jgi:hypothetical protein